MYNDSFKQRYKYAPVAVSISNTEKPTVTHIHNEIEMLYIKDGAAEIKIGEECFLAHRGDMYIVNPYEVHSVYVKETPYYHECVCFDCALIADKAIAKAVLDGSVQLPHFIEEAQGNRDDLIFEFERLFTAAEAPQKTLFFEGCACVSNIFASLIKNNQLKNRNGGDKNSIFCKRVIDFVAAHYREKISSKDIACELFYTQNHFCRTFIKKFGVSFSEYLNMYRILISTELLADNTKKISLIASECGFTDTVYFAKCFRRYKGESPSDYRKNQNNT